uniref:Uncharacterized protein n=1 Tax=Cynoglossus semilaevis TaxID=244447 RepID=A0A3P8VHX7_CYNSE
MWRHCVPHGDYGEACPLVDVLLNNLCNVKQRESTVRTVLVKVGVNQWISVYTVYTYTVFLFNLKDYQVSTVLSK